jgi:ABC-2 type transport system permease protein
MKTLFAFIKKEFMELVRSGRLTLLLVIFVIFGIMNPAMAKITPWLMETMADSLENTGLIVTGIKIDALTSWTQYYKNIEMALIIFALLVSNTFTKEYQSGTMILVLTKGLSRFKIVLAKTAVMMLLWTVCYWLCFGITYAYNEYFWDNSIVSHLIYSTFCFWLFGIWILSLIVMFSTIVQSNIFVLAGTGVTLVVFNLVNIFSSVKKYLPIKLMNSFTILTGEAKVTDFTEAVLLTIIISIACIGGSIIIFNQKSISSQTGS